MRLDDLFIAPDSTLAEALRKLDDTAYRILLVVRDPGVLVGTLTDGDVRRALLRDGVLEALVEEACNKDCVVLHMSERGRATSIMRELQLDAIPIMNGDGEVVDCVFRDGPALRRETRAVIDLPVVVMAGGMGTRLYPYTKILPKPLIPVNDVPIVERVINSFREQGCSSFYMVVNHRKEMIETYFAGVEKHYSVQFIEEQEFLGTGGGVKLARGYLNSTFVLTNCDILVNFDLNEAVQLHRESGNAVTIVASLKNYEIPYGTIEMDAGGSVASMIEKPTIPFLVNTGCYLVEPSAIDLIQEGESIGFPSVIERCKDTGMSIGVYPISEKSWLDMGQIDEFRNMSEALRL